MHNIARKDLELKNFLNSFILSGLIKIIFFLKLYFLKSFCVFFIFFLKKYKFVKLRMYIFLKCFDILFI